MLVTGVELTAPPGFPVLLAGPEVLVGPPVLVTGFVSLLVHPPLCGRGSSLSFDLLANSGSSFGSQMLISQHARRHFSASVKAFV